MALGQEETDGAEALIAAAENGALELVLPAFSLAEPFGTIAHRGRQRRQLAGTVRQQVAQLQRSAPHQNVLPLLQPVDRILVDLEATEFRRLDAVMRRLLRICRSLPLSARVLERAAEARERHGLEPADSLIYASVTDDLHSRTPEEPKCFVSRNYTDFGDEGIVAELGARGCRYHRHFAMAVEWAEDTTAP